MTPRTPLDIAAIRAALPEFHVRYTPETGSTNADLVATPDAPEWTVLLTDFQSAGRGRRGRSWTAPEGSQLIMSVMVRPPSIQHLGTLPLATGLAIVEALPIAAELKWPNDVLVDGHKLCGVLAEAVSLGEHPAIVVGFGINISLTREELPVPHATSLDLENEGVQVDRSQLAIDVLRSLRKLLGQWERGLDIMPAYRKVSGSIGQRVDVHLPGDQHIFGVVEGIADTGMIQVRSDDGQRHDLAAGDVTHLRPDPKAKDNGPLGTPDGGGR